MKTNFVRTSNVDRFLTTVAALDDRAAPEACMCLIQGEAGLGKTRTARWWAMQSDAILLRIKESMTPTWLLKDLVTELGEQVPANRVEKLFQQVVSIMAKNPRPIVVDEAERAIKNIAILENIRDLSDLMEMPVVLVGREYTWGKLKRHTQIKTRISSSTDFSKATIDDIKLLATTLCEVEVHDDVIQMINDQSDGYVREILKALKNAERIANRAKASEITAKLVEGKTLVQEVVSGPRRRRA